jgi:uncharacterized protein (TIGR00369 family)
MLRPGAPHIWRTLGYRTVEAGEGRMVIEWDADEPYAFPDTSDSVVVHGGMLATLLDTAMGGACASALTDDQSFLTADLHVEFYRPARPGTLRADGRIVQRTRRVAFCAAELTDADGQLLASARCTQILRSRVEARPATRTASPRHRRRREGSVG